MPRNAKGDAQAEPREPVRTPLQDLDYMGDMISGMKTLAFDHQFLMLVEILRLAQLEIQRTKRDYRV